MPNLIIISMIKNIIRTFMCHVFILKTIPRSKVTLLDICQSSTGAFRCHDETVGVMRENIILGGLVCLMFNRIQWE